MVDVPSHSDDYAEFEAEVVGNDDTKLNDFSDGSKLDGMAGVAATAAQVLRRWFNQRVLAAFIGGAEDDDLDYVVADRLGPGAPKREDGESNASFLARVDEYTENLGRGSLAAVVYYAGTLDGVISVESEEDLEHAITTVTARFDPEVTDADTLLEDFFEGLDHWRSDGGAVNLELVEV